MRTIAELSEAARTSLAGKRIFFGHQSVGRDIMEGVAGLCREQPSLGVKIIGVEDSRGQPGGFFAHATIGRNEHPDTKTEAFARLLDDGLASRVDIAFHKYCFVDVTARVSPERVFSGYREAMTRLRALHPNVTFVHVTMPLTTVQSGPKAVVKKWLGRAPAGYADNFAREEFNESMRRTYAGREPLFDLAALEASNTGGQSVTVSFRGTRGRVLFAPLTGDGGHLNETGRRLVAESLLVFLAELR